MVQRFDEFGFAPEHLFPWEYAKIVPPIAALSDDAKRLRENMLERLRPLLPPKPCSA
jgi:hypothetical protein